MGTYLDSSAIVKLAVREPESDALRRHLGHRHPLISSALARTEVLRALRPAGGAAVEAGRRCLALLDLVRINDQVLEIAAALPPIGLRSLDAIHLATAERLRPDLLELVTYDVKMGAVADSMGLVVSAPR